jgi:hypothetical protein
VRTSARCGAAPERRLRLRHFTNETASGWQTVSFAQPITISAGTTYVASYHSNGFYAATPNYFTTSYTNGAPDRAERQQRCLRLRTGSLFPSRDLQCDELLGRCGLPKRRATVATTRRLHSTILAIPPITGTTLTIQASALLANDSDPDGNTI